MVVNYGQISMTLGTLLVSIVSLILTIIYFIKEILSERRADTQMDASSPVTAEQVLNSFNISDDSLRKIKTAINKEFELGLKDEDKATVKMLITYVREMTRGDEEGTYLALDLGGTNFRVLLVSMEAGVAKVTGISAHEIPEKLFVTKNGQDLFDYIALKLLQFVQEQKLKRRRISLGFTFSFPCKQYGLTQSVLVKWNKGFNVGGVVGTDVVKQLKDALKRQLSGLVEAYIDVVAVINDTTGTLVACANTNKDCCIGLIVGTGFNACYIERLDKCEKWPANYNSPKQVIINCEWGAMGDSKENRELDPFRNEFDVEIDKMSINPNNQTYEKMVAGMYIGELLRLSIIKLFKAKVLFANQPDVAQPKPTSEDADENADKPNKKCKRDTKGCAEKSLAAATKTIKSSTRGPGLKQTSSQITTNASDDGTKAKCPGHKLYWKDIVHGKHISMLAKDELSGTTDEAKILVEYLCISSYTQEDLALIVKLASKIIHRSAHLVAAGISTLLERCGRPKGVIGFDGSVIKMHPYFLRVCIQKCTELTPKQIRFEFLESSDGSGIGAAVVAAALHKERRPLYIVKQGRLFELHYGKLKKEPQ